MDLILKNFPSLNADQTGKFRKLLGIVPDINRDINVVSRKDIGRLEERHVLHSLAIACVFGFGKGCEVIDAGTGGGFPGIPLAILFPEARFILVDSIAKKVRVTREVAESLSLDNVTVHRGRIESSDLMADFVVSRAVASFPKLAAWTMKLIRPGASFSRPNGLIALKGGDLDSELGPYRRKVEIFPISNYLEGSFYSRKMMVYLKK